MKTMASGEDCTPTKEHYSMMTLLGYSDASFAPEGSRSHQAIMSCLGGAPVFFKSNRQALMTTSTAESELLAEVDCFIAMKGIAALIREMVKGPIRQLIGVDNAAAVSMTTGGGGGPVPWRTRHLRIRAATLVEAVELGEVAVRHVPGVFQVADIATKTLPATTLRKLMRLLMMFSLLKLTESSSTNVVRRRRNENMINEVVDWLSWGDTAEWRISQAIWGLILLVGVITIALNGSRMMASWWRHGMFGSARKKHCLEARRTKANRAYRQTTSRVMRFCL